MPHPSPQTLPALPDSTSPSNVILPQALPDPNPQLPDSTSPYDVVLPRALPDPNPQTLPALPNLSAPGLEEVLSGASSSGQPVEVPDISVNVPHGNSQKCKNLQDKAGVELLVAEPPVTSCPKCARIELRRNKIANSIGQENTTQKKSKTQKYKSALGRKKRGRDDVTRGTRATWHLPGTMDILQGMIVLGKLKVFVFVFGVEQYYQLATDKINPRGYILGQEFYPC
ncbi:uncharacterized protein HD556DRAFT_1302882 [Suillus plorans]|uniref:Uncharacterized protein n=1 Tax=Suillus plorans TaxID=116603 RepID=A0A9P7DYP7_9AGAM|nr:uncharacterized protein HD556DRAFT_1302882 [Suillus plorans]KAG1806395.1 hypothetical protein HD556DRAFT_1302882 [Suillus plorans]